MGKRPPRSLSLGDWEPEALCDFGDWRRDFPASSYPQPYSSIPQRSVSPLPGAWEDGEGKCLGGRSCPICMFKCTLGLIPALHPNMGL